MKTLKKTLHLNYSVPKGEKTVQKSYNFEANTNIEDSVLKEVGDELSKLVEKNIENVSLTTTALI
ncbi:MULTISPECIES: hypothetical protein [Gemella]|uniref:hypothetical protein n=1 Tax=Gemella TaxID=1378 RepID=UPI00076800E5|nr:MULTISPECIES: hypothetical protein [Gemella]AME08845.1 hypothetical protein AXE85_00865 [Gemella sp. oral taxon 928]AXI26414.1 hypothetical protein CG018_02620 [Gemella sp. ND 6198]